MGISTTRSTNKKTENYITWFEIPALNLQRAVAFYNHIYGILMETVEMENHAMAFFPPKSGIGGAVVVGQGCIPSETGTLVYLNGGKDLTTVLMKIEEAGGRIIMQKTQINPEVGYFALFLDTEGNRLALHSKN